MADRFNRSVPVPDAPFSEDAGRPSSLVEAAFYDDRLGARLPSLSYEDLDWAPFGVIGVDRRGIVQLYNRFEARFSGRDAEETVGRHFFDEVAPCTRNRTFRTRFEEGLDRGVLDTVFSYTFTYRLRPTLVDVRMLLDQDGRPWILIRPKAGPQA
jgi:photoactive yellow protein